MEIQQKPDYLIFAEGSKSGELSDFPDIERGWGVTLEQTQAKPPLEWMNGAFNRIDKNTLYLLQQGIPEWSESVLYPIGAIIKVGGILYEAKTQNTNLNPTNSTNDWQLVVRFQDATTKQKGIVQLSSETDSESETQAATSSAVKSAYDLANGALPKKGGTVSGATNFTGSLQKNGVDVLKVGDGGIKSQTGEVISDLSQHLTGGFFQTTTNSISNNPSPFPNSSACLTVLPTNSPNWKTEVLSVCGSTTPYLYVRNDTSTGKGDWFKMITSANVGDYTSSPIGIPHPWPTVIPPSGWLKCNGSSFDKSLYPKLAIVYPTGKLPDLRGEFIRGLDDDRDVDLGRTILSSQGDAMRNFKGEFENNGLAGKNGFTPTGPFQISKSGLISNQNNDHYGQRYLFDPSLVVPTANENRPRNIAFLYIVKAE